jgi:hypothetical protein
MQQTFHIQITTQALQEFFSPRALQEVIRANIGQDALRGQVGHPEFHFDDNAFSQGNAYLSRQRELLREALENHRPMAAWQAFGRLTHAAQDFYAHSNYVRLWLEAHPGATPGEILPLDERILNHPSLHSGRVFLIELFAYLPLLKQLLRPLLKRLLPQDTHLHMNLDAPEKGPLFPYATIAAVRRTRQEYEDLLIQLPPEKLIQFQDGESG